MYRLDLERRATYLYVMVKKERNLVRDTGDTTSSMARRFLQKVTVSQQTRSVSVKVEADEEK